MSRMGGGPHPMTGQSRTDGARCGAPLACHPVPSPTFGEGVDSRLRGNDGPGAGMTEGLGAMNRAPTEKPTLCKPYGPPPRRHK